MTTNPSEITELIRLAGQGDQQAGDRLMESMYPHLRAIARRMMRSERRDHTLQPTALVNEAYLKMFGNAAAAAEDRIHFLSMAAKQMRQILASHGRRHRAAKRGGGMKVAFDEGVMAAGAPRIHEVAVVEELIERLEKVAPDAARITVLKFYGGMTDEEVAVAVGTNHTDVRREWTFARNWMRSRLNA
jgi:RNA polymerase sigma factor (TIGR02999 family)